MGSPDLSHIITAPALTGLVGQSAPWWLWSLDGSRLVLTNAEGASAMGASGAPAAMERSYSPSHAFASQIARLATQLPDSGEPRNERLRLFGRVAASMLLASARKITIDEENYLLVSAPPGAAKDEAKQACQLVQALPVAALVFSNDGVPLAASRTAQSLANVSLQRLLGTATDRVLGDLFSTGQARIELVTGILSLSVLKGGETLVGAYALHGRMSEEPQRGLRLVEPAHTPVAGPENVESPASATTLPASADVSAPDLASRFGAFRPVTRLVWRTDRNDTFLDNPQGLAALVGEAHATIEGRSFSELANALGFDLKGDAARAFASRTVWSGVTVMWPCEDMVHRVVMTLSAVPLLENGQFGGYRGFAVTSGERFVLPVVRPTETLVPETEAEATPATIAEIAATPAEVIETQAAESAHAEVEASEPAAPTPPATEDNDSPIAEKAPLQTPVATELARHGFTLVQSPENVVPLRNTPLDQRRNTLTPVERLAFREIARTLQGKSPDDTETTDAPSDTDAASARTTPPAAEIATPAQASTSAPVATAPVEEAPITFAFSNELTGSEPLTTNAVEAEADEVSHEILPVIEAPLLPANNGEESVAAASSDTVPEEPVAKPPQPDFDRDEVLDRVPVGLLIYRGNVVLYANRTLLDWTGYEDAAHLEQAGGLARLFAGADDNNSGDTSTLTDAQGESFSVAARLSRVNFGGDPALMFTLRKPEPAEIAEHHDIDTFSATETSLAEVKGRLDEVESILDTATDGIAVISQDGSVESLNHSAEALFGYESGDIKGRSFTQLFAPDSQRVAADYLEGLTSNGVASILNDGREVVGRVKQGGLIPLYLTLGRIGNGERKKFAAVFRDMTQWKKAEADLREARRAAEKASSHKSDFLAKISHEIRTPLNAIIGFSEVMMEERFGAIGNDRYRDYMRDIHVSGSHVLSLINDLLDLSKIEAGKLELSFTSVDLNAVVQQCAAIIQPQANRERVIIRSSLHPRLPRVVADDRSVRQIVLNLLSNSVKFTPPSGQVIISTTLSAQGEAVIRVRDTGAGMSEAEIRAALEPFRQIASPTPASSVPGTGLGLPLTKALVEANRASFGLTSQPGQGTLVEVTFPPTRVLAE